MHGHTLLSSNGEISLKTKYFVENKRFLCLLIFPCMLHEGNLEDKSVPHYLSLESCMYLIENHRHNYGQYLTTPSRTHSNNHFASFYSAILNISIVGENSVYAHSVYTEMCFCACVYMKSVHPTFG